MSINTSYSTFTDPHLKQYYTDERRLKHLRTSGLINKNNEVYPERVYQMKIAQADRKQALKQLKFQKDVREALHKQHIDLHKQWNEKEKEKEKPNRVISAKTQPSKPICSNNHLCDLAKWTKKDFIKHGFDYYPDHYRPQTSPNIQWHKLNGNQSTTRSHNSDKSPYLDVPYKFQGLSIKNNKISENSRVKLCRKRPNTKEKNDGTNPVVNLSSNNASNEKPSTTPMDNEKQNESALKNPTSEQNDQNEQQPTAPFKSTMNQRISPMSLKRKFISLTRSLSSPNTYIRAGISNQTMNVFKISQPIDLLDNDF